TAPTALRRFAREAKLLASMRHPNIVEYVASGQTEDGTPYLAMEWLDGEVLSARLAREPLRPKEAVDLCRYLAEALGFAHARSVVHRDIKPHNLFLVGGRLEAVKLLDFGIANLGAEPSMTQTGAVVGTPGYMSPEQAGAQRGIGPQADVFALGCVL